MIQIVKNRVGRNNLTKGDIDEVEDDDEDDASSITQTINSTFNAKTETTNAEGIDNLNTSGEIESPNFHRFQKRQEFIRQNPDTPDLYITQAEDIEVLLPFLTNFKDATIYDPCCGTGIYGEVLRKNGFEKVVESDLNFGENRLDFLDADAIIPDYDLILTNPPYNKKYKFLKKMYQLKKPFAVLLPFDTASYVGCGGLFEKYGVTIMLIYPRPFFMHKGKKVHPSATAYFVGNAGNSQQEPTQKE